MTLNTTFAYALPSPQQNANFSLSVTTVSRDVQVVSNQATMYALFQGVAPAAYIQNFRWIPVGQSWEDSPGNSFVNFVAFCTFNFGSYVLCTVNSLS